MFINLINIGLYWIVLDNFFCNISTGLWKLLYLWKTFKHMALWKQSKFTKLSISETSSWIYSALLNNFFYI